MPAGDRPAADPGDLDALAIDALTWLAPSISHELANPLAALVAFSGLMATDERLPADLRADVRMLRDEAERTSRLVRTLLELLRDRPAVVTSVDVAGILDEVLALASTHASSIRLERHVDEPPPAAETDPSALRRALVALVADALQCLGRAPRGATLRTEVVRAAGDRVHVSVAYDRGASAGAQAPSPRVPTGEMPLARLDGILRVERREDGGRLTIDLPAAEVAAGDGGDSPHGPAAARQARRLTVVVCDDEDAIRALLVRVLERDGIRAIPAADAAEALGAIRDGAVDVLVTDHRMAGTSGIELYEQAAAARPELVDRVVIMSGEPGADELRAFAERTGVRVIAKPFEVTSIPALVREVARQGDPAGQRG